MNPRLRMAVAEELRQVLPCCPKFTACSVLSCARGEFEDGAGRRSGSYGSGILPDPAGEQGADAFG